MPPNAIASNTRIKSPCTVLLQQRSPSSSSSFMNERRSLPELDGRLTGMFPLLSRRKVGQNLRPVNQPLAGYRRPCRNVAGKRTGDASIMIRVAFVIGDYPPEQLRLREEAARSYSSDEVEVGILSVPARPFDGLTPAEIQGAAPLFHEAFRQAEREGYDAVVPLGMLDLGVDGGRSAVDIPVVAPLQAVLHVAAQVGEHFGVVCYHASAIPRHRAQCIAYGMESFIAGRRASGFYVQQIADNKDKMVESFLAAARALIAEDGADVIIPQGITQCPVQMKPAWLSAQLGVPVVEGIGAPIRMAAMLAALGLKQSRIRWQKQGSQPR